MLRKLDRLDKKYSGYVHNWDTHYFELPFMFAGMIFAPFIVPFVVASIYIISVIYFRSDDSIVDGHKLFNKAFAYTMIYLLWVILGLILTVCLKKFLYRERPNPGKTARLMELRWNEHNGAFPSGDTLQSAMYVGYVLITFPASGSNSYLQYILLAAVPLVAFSRIYYHCHWIGDTVVGAIVGFMLSCLAFLTTKAFY
ncbi:unnamed protein product [Moneuplotes crassus]|uniref:Phosphatidic acid phosphatase type 2/haloperoxidase domain-containing protein n=1 Tax=Euplotes crassus TaxID=5936 RepID=A0AAD2D556_EUPCR|nr:unnamed protein product [Moneuplotes crassus]